MYSVALVLAFAAEITDKIDNWKIRHWPILAVYLKDFFFR